MRMTSEMRMLKAGIILCLYVFILLHAGVCDLQLESLDYGSIFEVSQSKCLVTVPKTLLDDRKALSLLSSAMVSFENEPKVSFYHVDFTLMSSYQSALPNTDYGISFVVFKLLRKDRTCLLTPKANGHGKLQKPYVYSFEKEIDYNLANIVAFINDKCLTFRKTNGHLTPAGIHEEYILNNLFSVLEKTTNVDGESLSSNMDKKDHYLGGNGNNELFCSANSNGCEAVNESGDNKYENSPTESTHHHCERIPAPTSSSDFLNEYVTKSKPVIITGATSQWKVFKKWKNEFLREKYGDIKVHIKITPNGEYEGVESTSLWENKSKVKIPHDVLKQLKFPDLVVVRPATMEIQFSEFIDLIESIASSKSSNISAYLEYSSLSYFRDLEKDIAEMSFIDGVLDLKHTNIWLSDGNTVGKLHFDPFDNFMCQISGEKEFILYDPHENERLYEAHIQEAILSYNTSTKNFSRQKLMESTSMVMSPVDIEKPNFKRFPRFSEAKPMSCKIQPGDVLFTPAFWWHEVRSKPNTTEHRNLAVNFWYDPFFLKEFPCAECRLYVNPKYFHLL